MNTFTNSYVVTNRQYADDTFGSSPQTAGDLSYLMALVPGKGIDYQSDASQYAVVANGNTTDATLPPDFSTALLSDLQATLDSSQRAYLTVFIHGLDTDWTDATKDLALVGNGLRALPGIDLQPKNGASSAASIPAAFPAPWYTGLVVGFSWPSVQIGLPDFISDFHANRTNANASTVSLANFLNALQGLATQFTGGLELSLLAHSEGTYVTQQAGGVLPQGSAAVVSQVVLLAADLDTTALGSYPNKTPCGAGLSQGAAQVTAYWSVHDDVLGLVGNVAAYRAARHWGTCICDGTIGRLGKSGPPADQSLYANCISLDCSSIVNEQDAPSGVETHLAYLYIPQVLQDIAQVLMGQTPTQRTGSTPRQTLC